MGPLDMVAETVGPVIILAGLIFLVVIGFDLFDVHAHVPSDEVQEHKNFSRIFGILLIILGILSLCHWIFLILALGMIALVWIVFD